VFVPSAFFTARAGNFSAHPANLMGKLGAAGHKGRCREADSGAVPVEGDAPGHHFNVLLLQTGCGAMLAFHGAIVASSNASFVFVM
jgi:hypothetical protein